MESIPRSESNSDQLLTNGVGTQCWHLSRWAPTDQQTERFPAGSGNSEQREALGTELPLAPMRQHRPRHNQKPLIPLPPRNCERVSAPSSQGCSPRSTAWRAATATALRLLFAKASLRTSSPHLELPEVRLWGGGIKNPETERFPKPRPRNKITTPRSLESLPVFHFCVCVSFPHPLKNLRKKGGGGANRPQKLAIRALVLRRPLPALPTCARREV